MPGPGKGWRQTRSSGMPRFVPRIRTSSLKLLACSLQMGRGGREATFEELAEGFNELEFHVFKETTDVLIFLLEDS